MIAPPVPVPAPPPGGDAVLLAGELVAAARPTHALEDAVAHERLQDRFEMAGWEPVTSCQCLGSYRPAVRMQRDVNHGGNGENAFARQERHG
jgi:hypothetical protein